MCTCILQFQYHQIHPWLPIVNGVKQEDEVIEIFNKWSENKVEDKLAEEKMLEDKLAEEENMVEGKKVNIDMEDHCVNQGPLEVYNLHRSLPGVEKRP